jgi:hypothetical protein
MTPASASRLLDQVPLERYTPHTITDPDALEREIETGQARGPCLDNEEFLPGLFCVAVLVPRPGGRSNTCIAIQAPVMRSDPRQGAGLLPALQRAGALSHRDAIDAAAAASPSESRLHDERPQLSQIRAELRPTQTVSVREVFGIDSDLMVPAFAERDDHVPEIDAAYRFNPRPRWPSSPASAATAA